MAVAPTVDMDAQNSLVFLTLPIHVYECPLLDCFFQRFPS